LLQSGHLRQGLMCNGIISANNNDRLLPRKKGTGKKCGEVAVCRLYIKISVKFWVRQCTRRRSRHLPI